MQCRRGKNLVAGEDDVRAAIRGDGVFGVLVDNFQGIWVFIPASMARLGVVKGQLKRMSMESILLHLLCKSI